MLDARPDFKQDYKNDWVYANAREYLVLGILNQQLAKKLEYYKNHPKRPRFRDVGSVWAALSGHGAGTPGVVAGWHSGAGDKFDITVYVDGVPAAYIEVTGVEDKSKLKDNSCVRSSDYCVGSWKLRDAERHGILDKTWFAFAVMERKSIRMLKATRLAYFVDAEYPGLRTCKLRKKEDVSYCLDYRVWRPVSAFINWFYNTAIYQALAEKVLLEEMEKHGSKPRDRPDPW